MGTRYSLNKKKKKKRFGFGLQIFDPQKETSSDASSQQERLLRPSFFRPDRRPARTSVVPRPQRRFMGGYLSLEEDDRKLIEDLRSLTKRSLGDDSQRLDMLIATLTEIGVDATWCDAEGDVPAHWKVFREEPAEEPNEEEDEDPVVRQDEPEKVVDAPA